MKLKNFVNMTRNSRNNQVSFNLKSRELKKVGITPQNLLELKFSKTFKLMKENSKGGLKNDNNRRTKSLGSE